MSKSQYRDSGAAAPRHIPKPRLFRFQFVILILALLFFPGASGDETVYVTNSGTKYHRSGCSSLRSSKIAVSLADAAGSGYGVCSICKPPELDSTEKREENLSGLYRVNTAELKNTSAADLGSMLAAEVIDHVDGDTIRVRIPNPPKELGVVETVRLLGVDTPETVHPNQPVQRFGEEASDFTKSRLLGRTVFMAFDWDLRDRYGRLLAYIYTQDGLCFNTVLLHEGYGFAYLRYPFQFSGEFRNLEQNAKKEKHGLWGN